MTILLKLVSQLRVGSSTMVIGTANNTSIYVHVYECVTSVLDRNPQAPRFQEVNCGCDGRDGFLSNKFDNRICTLKD